RVPDMDQTVGSSSGEGIADGADRNGKQVRRQGGEDPAPVRSHIPEHDSAIAGSRDYQLAVRRQRAANKRSDRDRGARQRPYLASTEIALAGRQVRQQLDAAHLDAQQPGIIAFFLAVTAELGTAQGSERI